MKTYLIMTAAAVMAVGCSHNHKHHEEQEENEVKVSIYDVPIPVRETLEREAGGSAISSIDKETKDEKVIYEADITSGGKNWEIKVDANGKLLSKKLDD